MRYFWWIRIGDLVSPTSPFSLSFFLLTKPTRQKKKKKRKKGNCSITSSLENEARLVVHAKFATLSTDSREITIS